MRVHLIIALVAPLLLNACADKNYNALDAYLTKRAIDLPEKDSFQSCRGYGCQFVDTIAPNKRDWKRIEKPFLKPAKNVEQEREKIAQSIAAFEDVVGEHNGTSADIWGTFQKTGHNQQDCVDESINTSMYMRVLEQRGHIKFHTVETPQSRVPFLRWPHQTAVLKEKDSGKIYAIDSWFHDNGLPPEIVDFKTWKSGWKPDKETEEPIEPANEQK